MAHHLAQNGDLLPCRVQHLLRGRIANFGAQIDDFGGELFARLLLDAPAHR